MSQDPTRSTPLSRQLLIQLDWLTQVWATGAEPSAPVQATLDPLAAFQRWSSHRWSLGHPSLRTHRTVRNALQRRLGKQQCQVLLNVLDTAAKIPDNGSAEELAIALRYLTPKEQDALMANLTQQWQTQRRFRMLLQLVAQVPGRSQPPLVSEIQSHLMALFETNDVQIQAMSLFLLHQLSLQEGRALATQLLSCLQLDPLLLQVAQAIVQAPGEPVDIDDCPSLLELANQELEDRAPASIIEPPPPPVSGNRGGDNFSLDELIPDDLNPDSFDSDGG